MNRKLLDLLPRGASERIAAALDGSSDVPVDFSMALCNELLTLIEHLDGRLRELESKATSDA